MHFGGVVNMSAPRPPAVNIAELARQLRGLGDARRVTRSQATSCMRIAEQQLEALQNIRKSADVGVNTLSKYLHKEGFPIKPPTGSTFTLNILFHVLVLFTALTVLYITVVAPMESQSLQKEVDTSVQSAIRTAYDKQAPATQQQLQQGLNFAMPALLKLRKRYAGDDPCRVAHNKTVLAQAWTIVGLLAVVFVVAVAVLAASGVSMGRPVAHIIFENLIIFAVVGVVEFMFFKLVASKFIPVMPSEITRDALQAVDQAL